MAPVSAPALEVEGLVKRYAGRSVVDRLSFTVPLGTVCALLGPNGAGKTTTIEICEGFRRPDEGHVRVLGSAPADPATRARVGVMPQSGGAYPGLRAGEMLRLVASYYREPLDAEDLLRRLGLAEMAETTCRRLSGGQQQRLSLALAVVGRPELIFLDEPTAGLDPHSRHETWDLIRALRADGVSLVLTTHLMDEVEQLADDVLVINQGREVARGSVAELTRLDGAGSLSFRAIPGLAASGLAHVLPRDCSVVEPRPGEYLVTGPVDTAVLATLSGWCAERGVHLEDLKMGTHSLEQVYLSLTGPGGQR